MQRVISNCESSLHNVKSQFHFAKSVCTFAGRFCNLRVVSARVQGPFVNLQKLPTNVQSEITNYENVQQACKAICKFTKTSCICAECFCKIPIL